MNIQASPYIMCRMSEYIPDDAAMTRDETHDPMEREQTRHRRTMNMLQARKDRLIDLLATPLPAASRRQLTDELTELKRDIAKVRYGASEHDWYEMQHRWEQRR